MGWMIFGVMHDCCGEPQELKEVATREEAIRFMRKEEETCHPDIAHWAECGNDVVDSSCSLPEDPKWT